MHQHAGGDARRISDGGTGQVNNPYNEAEGDGASDQDQRQAVVNRGIDAFQRQEIISEDAENNQNS